jgi:hypothetical protein
MTECTVVTAYYPVRSKFSVDKYLDWATTFLKIKSPVVLFTEEHMVESLLAKRGNLPIHIITIPFCELDTWKLYQNHWVEHLNMDPEKHIHSPELYAIWAQKAFFVDRTVQLNPFNTKFFFWCDIGAFRDKDISPVILDSFPTTQYLERYRILLQSIGDVTTNDWIRREDGIRGEVISSSWNETRLVGGLWGGGAEACMRWKHAYQSMLEEYFRAGRFAGKDQQVMLSAYLENPSLAKVVYCTKPYINMWFFLEYLLSNQEEQYELNLSYIKY